MLLAQKVSGSLMCTISFRTFKKLNKIKKRNLERTYWGTYWDTHEELTGTPMLRAVKISWNLLGILNNSWDTHDKSKLTGTPMLIGTNLLVLIQGQNLLGHPWLELSGELTGTATIRADLLTFFVRRCFGFCNLLGQPWLGPVWDGRFIRYKYWDRHRKKGGAYWDSHNNLLGHPWLE